MTINNKVVKIMEENAIEYECIEHPVEFSAMRVAGQQHVPGKEMIKPVIINADGKFVMCVVPSVYYVDLLKVKSMLGAKNAELASEKDLERLFPDCEIGAEPPFGQLYDMTCFVDQSLTANTEIVFNGGTHTKLVKMKGKDFFKISKHTLGDIGIPIHLSKAA